MQPPRVVFEDERFRITHEPDTGLVLFKRTNVPLPAGPAALEMMTRIDAALSEFDPSRTAMLFDLRDAPASSDEAYQEGVMQARRRIESRFTINAVVVKTAVGKLQVTRVAREEGRPPAAFLNEADARAYLLGAIRRA